MQRKGFTLIELLVVIGIIGVISSVVLSNMNSSRGKARDGKRIADLRQIQLALESYAAANGGKYPAATTLTTDLAPYLPAFPTPPGGTTQTSYKYAALGTGASCYGYHLGAILEQANQYLSSDADATALTACTNGGTDFRGDSAACTTTAGTDMCYDLKNQ